MANNKLLKCWIVALCLVISLLLFTLSAYNAGRECLQSEPGQSDLLWFGWIDARHYAYDFDFRNINLTEFLKSLFIPTILSLVPWMIWALRRRNFTMSGGRWLLLLATITVLTFEVFTEVWKVLNSVWYCDFDFGDGPPWWLVFESLNVICGLICFCTVAYILGEAIFDGIMFIARKINRKRYSNY